MKRRYKVASWFLGIPAIAIVVLGSVLAYTPACSESVEAAAPAGSMAAIQRRCYGPPQVLELVHVPRPVPAAGELLVKVHAASVNPLDWHVMRGKPFIMRMDSGIGVPKNPKMGVDFSGTVEAVGAGVKTFKVGDDVFGGRRGAFAEYLAVNEADVARKPANASHADAAAVPIAAVTALQALRNEGHLKAGQKVLINGASGGVGTYAVQIAKALGAEVTGVCSTRNVGLVASLGADRVLDYQNVDFTRDAARYDLVVDTVGNRSIGEVLEVLQPQGIYVVVGAPSNDPWLGPVSKLIAAKARGSFTDHPLKFFIADLNATDLGEVANMMLSGRVKSVIDRTYPLAQVPQAVAYVEEGHARGKVIVSISP